MDPMNGLLSCRKNGFFSDLSGRSFSSITPTSWAIRLIDSGDLPFLLADSSIRRCRALISSPDMYVLSGATQPSVSLPMTPIMRCPSASDQTLILCYGHGPVWSLSRRYDFHEKMSLLC